MYKAQASFNLDLRKDLGRAKALLPATEARSGRKQPQQTCKTEKKIISPTRA